MPQKTPSILADSVKISSPEEGDKVEIRERRIREKTASGFTAMRKVSAKQWLSLLGGAPCTIAPHLSGLPGYFPVASNWDTGWRSLNEHLFYFVVQNECEVQVAQKTARLIANDLIWISPGTPFRFSVPAGTQSPPVLYRFRLALTKGKAAYRLHDPFRLKPAMPNGRIQVQQIINNLEHPDPYSPLRLRALLLLLSIETLVDSSEAPNQKGLSDHARTLIYHYVSDHIAEHPTTAALARLVRLSPGYFTRIFRATYGMSTRRWLLQQRMNHAALRLKQSQLTVSEIAEQLGYHSVFLFSRQFKQAFGCSPRSYR